MDIAPEELARDREAAAANLYITLKQARSRLSLARLADELGKVLDEDERKALATRLCALPKSPTPPHGNYK